MQNLQFSWMTLGLATSLLFGVTACQPQAANLPEPNEIKPAQQINQQATIAAKPAIVSKPSVTAKTCLTLSKSMQQVDDTSKIEDMYTIQKILETCLPTANNAEVLALLKNYQAMYDRFLASGLDSESDYETFNSAIYELYYGEGLSSTQLKTLTPRDQYLVALVKSDVDVSIYAEGEGYFSFTHNLKAMADIFTPYLREDQSKFIQRMATDNQ